MEILLDILSWVLLLAGGVIAVLSAYRRPALPDVFTRMHAASMLDSLGALKRLPGLALQSGWTLITFKLGLTYAFLLLTTATAAHVLGKSAIRSGLEPLIGRDAQRAPRPSTGRPDRGRRDAIVTRPHRYRPADLPVRGRTGGRPAHARSLRDRDALRDLQPALGLALRGHGRGRRRDDRGRGRHRDLHDPDADHDRSDRAQASGRAPGSRVEAPAARRSWSGAALDLRHAGHAALRQRRTRRSTCTRSRSTTSTSPRRRPASRTW